ncbi:MAG: hypothetical protein ACFFFH_03820 [Candidatus Thorarchaeota archaeon]
MSVKDKREGASISHKTAELPIAIQNVHIASENRINMTYERKTVQDFKERYFSGNFYFEINVTKCTPKQLGLLIEGAMAFDRLGRGYNTGYGRVEVKRIKLFKRTIKHPTPKVDVDGSFVIERKVIDEPLDELFKKALGAWRDEINA